MRFGDHERELCGGELVTTNNRMELTAVIEGLRALTKPCAVTLHVDSKYVLEGATKWILGWKRNGWRTSDKKPVKNVELWQALDAEMQRTPFSGCGSRATRAIPEMSARTRSRTPVSLRLCSRPTLDQALGRTSRCGIAEPWARR